MVRNNKKEPCKYIYIQVDRRIANERIGKIIVQSYSSINNKPVVY